LFYFAIDERLFVLRHTPQKIRESEDRRKIDKYT